MKTALVIGATGLVGGELVKELLQAPNYEKIIVFVRRPLPIHNRKLEQVTVDFDHLDSYASHLAGVHDVFCCLGTTIKKAGSQEAFRRVDYTYPLELAKLAQQAQVKKFLLITALGSNAHSKVFYNRVKGEVEQAITALGLPTVHIIRPSLLLGDRPEFRLGERIGTVFAKAFTFATPKNYRAIHARTVARAMSRLAQQPDTGVHIHESGKLQVLGA
ncbi:oxidoreductase [Tumebacillus permanentifrigoris]|uniref:Uncharacterized protein YbjT (DUF2867 family) n=1 Tax=Tumebacillus permanentifrigoris TaxID=378543 RepID=A0A316DFJ1_9BACL|nr:oxidoreductase [Tumebacillus permanentifrigoris]PWK15979.1 uncharacterized protein YbjT (DUF2867 family) [Tumebacillus permanentifrigoris]